MVNASMDKIIGIIGYTCLTPIIFAVPLLLLSLYTTTWFNPKNQKKLLNKTFIVAIIVCVFFALIKIAYGGELSSIKNLIILIFVINASHFAIIGYKKNQLG